MMDNLRQETQGFQVLCDQQPDRPEVDYLGGPMTGLENHNFPSFFVAEACLVSLGRTVINPARNFGGRTDLPREVYLRRDLEDLMRSQRLVLLPGWEDSAGACLEMLVAGALEIPVVEITTLEAPELLIYYTALTPSEREVVSRVVAGLDDEWVERASYDEVDEDEEHQSYQADIAAREQSRYYNEEPEARTSILAEADAAVNGDRRADYGTPLDNHTRTAAYWTAYLRGQGSSYEVTPEDVCMLNILQKISRSHQALTRDTLVDIAGYAANIELIDEERVNGAS